MCMSHNFRYVLYKLPVIKTSSNSLIQKGLGYAYITSDSVSRGWVISDFSINDTRSIPGRTLEPLYKSSRAFKVFLIIVCFHNLHITFVAVCYLSSWYTQKINNALTNLPLCSRKIHYCGYCIMIRHQIRHTALHWATLKVWLFLGLMEASGWCTVFQTSPHHQPTVLAVNHIAILNQEVITGKVFFASAWQTVSWIL